jgi:hypothetical protein
MRNWLSPMLLTVLVACDAGTDVDTIPASYILTHVDGMDVPAELARNRERWTPMGRKSPQNCIARIRCWVTGERRIGYFWTSKLQRDRHRRVFQAAPSASTTLFSLTVID